MKNNTVIAIAITSLVVGMLGFFGGMQYQKTKTFGNVENMRGFPGGSGKPNASSRTGNGLGGRPVMGEITDIDNSSITIKTQDGGSKIVVYSATTKINKTTEGNTSDLKTGEQVMVIGTEETGGTVMAQTISVGTNMLQPQPKELELEKE